MEREIHNFDPEIRRQLMAHFGRQVYLRSYFTNTSTPAEFYFLFLTIVKICDSRVLKAEYIGGFWQVLWLWLIGIESENFG